MGNVSDMTPYLEPLRKSVVVRRSPREAFTIFTERLGSWWPYQRFSLHQSDTMSCAMEPRVGGEIFETARDGSRAAWGTVIEWEPPNRFVMTWHPGHAPDTAQEVELRFIPVSEGTRVELEHRGWAKLGKEAQSSRDNYQEGWVVVFEQLYVEACS